MPAQDLPPGLYDHPLSAAVHQVLADQLQGLHQLQPLDPAEAPQRLARYLRQLSESALASLPEAQRQGQAQTLVQQDEALRGIGQGHDQAAFHDEGLPHRALKVWCKFCQPSPRVAALANG